MVRKVEKGAKKLADGRSVSRREAMRVLLVASAAAVCAPAVARAAEPAAEKATPVANSWRYVDGVPIDDVDGEGDGGISLFSSVPAWEKDETGAWCNSEGDPIEGALYRGIDVSEWQKQIDWDAVKAGGLVDYAILRAAAFAGETPSRKGVDVCWERNAKECERLGIPYGAYIYSYATNAAEAQEEADYILGLVKGHNLTCPIYIDIEDLSIINANLNVVAETFCKRIEAAGYRAGVYSGLNWWRDFLTSSSLDRWSRWVAQWNVRCDYEGPYDMWQATSKGHVAGIEGNVDINFDFVGLVKRRMFRLYNRWTGEHLYTADANERTTLAGLGWTDEGVGWVAPARSSVPVWRLYNPYVSGGDHHYTADKNEYDALKKEGWRQEGICWYSDDAKGVAVWRLYNPYAKTGTHHYTTDRNEYDTLAVEGWKQEEIAWYGVKY